MSDEKKVKSEPIPPAENPPEAPPATPPSDARPPQPPAPPSYTEEELKGFVLSEDLQDICDQADEEIEGLKSRRQQAIDQANRQVAAFDGAIEQQTVFKAKQVERAKKRFVEAKKKSAGGSPDLKVVPPSRTRARTATPPKEAA